MNLSRKIVLVIVSTFIALVFIVAVLSDAILLNSFRQLEKNNILSHIRQVYNQIQNRLEQNDVTARDFVINIVEQLHTGQKLTAVDRRYFSEYNLKLHQIDLAAIYDADGQFVAMRRIDSETGTYCAVNGAQRKAIDTLVRGSRDAGGRFLRGIAEVDGEPFMVSLKPFAALDGSSRGTLVVGCFLDRVEMERITKLTGFAATLTSIHSDQLTPDLTQADSELASTGGFVTKVLDDFYVSGYAYLKDVHGQPSFIVKISDQRLLFQQGKTSIYYILLVLVVCGAIFCCVMLLFIRAAVLKRLASLGATVGNISRNSDISSRLEVNGEDELEGLAESINNMLESLESAERSLKESEERYRSLFERAPDSIMILGTEDAEAGCIVAANCAAAVQHGYSVDELCALKIIDLNTPESNLVAGDIMERVAEGEWLTTELWHYKKDGSQFPIETHAGPLKIQGRTYILKFDRDITVRKFAEESDRMYLDQIRQLNEELERQAADLELANRELETFNYSVSHDMRGPLTLISGYCQLLLDDAAGLDPQARAYLSRIYESCRWLDVMIDTMLKLAQLTRADFSPEQVNLTAICEEQLDSLRRAEPGKTFDVLVAQDVMVLGDRSLLKILVANLVNNAWKYSVRSEQARIEFGVKTNDVVPVYFVRDNGVGFDMKDADKLFRVFTRLHDPTQFGGNGIGLATVQRIINRHGGRVWAEGEAGKGATFFFTLAPDVRNA
ncbi:MAG: PAS domain S-box protein [Desulfuromonadales bacterium]|nr:PAS domain S-box protein [Desulfuromonadales bacterium]